MKKELPESVKTTIDLIKSFHDAIESTRAKHSDKPLYLQSTINRAEKQIKKLYADLFFLLDLPEQDFVEKSLSSTVVLYGEETGEAFVTIKALDDFVSKFRSAVKAYCEGFELMFCVRAASTGSLHLSFEPAGEQKEKGLRFLEDFGKTAQNLSSKKCLKKTELTEFELAVARLLPQKKTGIQRIEFKGNVLSPGGLSFSRNEIKIKSSRKARKTNSDVFRLSGKVVSVNVESLNAIILTEQGKKRFFFTNDKKDELIDSLHGNHVVASVIIESSRLVLKKIDLMPILKEQDQK
ncbi:MAG: hypothetical protein AB1403_06185 [Candidatus Riflebacteria bacterium]